MSGALAKALIVSAGKGDGDNADAEGGGIFGDDGW